MRRVLTILLCTLPLAGCMGPGGSTPSESRHLIDQEADKTLNQLYQTNPELRGEVERAPGYAIFDQRGIKILLGGSETGYGVVINNKTKKHTYMRVLGADVGAGFGIQEYRVLMVFNDPDALANFVQNGWEVGGQADASAAAGGAGMTNAANVSLTGVRTYEITDLGAALQATVGASKFYPDDELNN